MLGTGVLDMSQTCCLPSVVREAGIPKGNCNAVRSAKYDGVTEEKHLVLFVLLKQILETGQFIKNRHLFLTVLESWEVQDQGTSRLDVWLGPSC